MFNTRFRNYVVAHRIGNRASRLCPAWRKSQKKGKLEDYKTGGGRKGRSPDATLVKKGKRGKRGSFEPEQVSGYYTRGGGTDNLLVERSSDVL